MTKQELRQLCADAFRLNLSMPWTPNQDIEYTYTLLRKSYNVSLPAGNAYSGLCYATGIDNATYGNAWKMLLYWDPETGALDVEAMGPNALNIISSACSYGAMQGWNRVSNSHGLKEMNSYSMYESNIVPVGPYEYDPSTYSYNFRSRSASDDIIEANGADTIYESYAMTDIADGVFSSSAYHVMMISQKPVVVRRSDGTIENGKDLRAGDIFAYVLYANYNLCDIKVEVQSPDGKALLSYYPFIATQPKVFYTSITAGLNRELVEPLANGKNTIHVYAQLSNGELVEAFHTLLKLN